MQNILSVSFGALTAALLSIAAITYNHPHRFVQSKIESCKKSGCSECGRFYLLHGSVEYAPSTCETLYEYEAKKAQEDADIRHKYGN